MKLTDLDWTWDADSFLWEIYYKTLDEYEKSGRINEENIDDIDASFFAFFDLGVEDGVHPERLTPNVMWFWNEVLRRYNERFKDDLPEEVTFF